MTSALRTRTEEEMFDDLPTPETRSPAHVQAAFARFDQDYDAIAEELGVPRDQVSFSIQGEGRDRRGWPTTYKLVGTAGPGDAYDPLQDKAALQRTTLKMLEQGAAAVGAAAKKS